jgi:hypothetical protein
VWATIERNHRDVDRVRWRTSEAPAHHLPFGGASERERVPGITRDGLVDRVGPRVSEGHAKRRYQAHLSTTGRSARVRALLPFEKLDPVAAKAHLVGKTLKDMRRNRSVERDDNGGYHVLRRAALRRCAQPWPPGSRSSSRGIPVAAAVTALT